MEFDTSDFQKLAFDLQGAGAEAAQMAVVVVKKTSKDIEATAKQLSPVDTGFNRSAIVTSDLRSTTQTSPEAEVKATSSYAAYLELGTSRMAAQPFMGPAADQHEPAFVDAMQQITGRLL
ncbi:Neck protein Ne1 [Glutamicibacter phage Montesquieu]|nr:Neck protein Ne1 [Glutamicibacter phage Montesquieu]